MTSILIFSGSARQGSLNTALARSAGEIAAESGSTIDEVDLGAMALPIFDGDWETIHGVPVAAANLAARVQAADAVLIGSPEYNGGPTALLKNAIDWVTRVEMSAFQGRKIGLLAATPGQKGGQHSLDIVESIFNWMHCDVHETFSLPKAHEAIVDGALIGEERQRLAIWVDYLIQSLN